MVKRKRSAFNSAKNVLSPEEYERYIKLKKSETKRNLLNDLARRESRERAISSRDKYNKPRTGKVASFIQGGKRVVSTGITKSLYGNKYSQLKDKTISGVKGSGRGRPRGTYDKRYARFGGVYGYRKWLRGQIAIKKAEARRRGIIDPQQRVVLQRFEQRRMQSQMSPEGKTIPDTYGNVSINGIMKEINDASNIFS